MTHHLDPDRRVPPSPHPGFAPPDIDLGMRICRRCAVPVPDGQVYQMWHAERDQRLDQFIALLQQLIDLLSDPGSLDPGSDPMSGVGEAGNVQRYARGRGQVAERPAPDTNSPPTPEQEEPAAVTRSGAGGPNHQDSQPGAGNGPPDATTAPDPHSPGGSGATTRTGRGSGGPGGSRVRAPAGTPTETAEQAELLTFEQRLADGGNWARFAR